MEYRTMLEAEQDEAFYRTINNEEQINRFVGYLSDALSEASGDSNSDLFGDTPAGALPATPQMTDETTPAEGQDQVPQQTSNLAYRPRVPVAAGELALPSYGTPSEQRPADDEHYPESLALNEDDLRPTQNQTPGLHMAAGTPNVFGDMPFRTRADFDNNKTRTGDQLEMLAASNQVQTRQIQELTERLAAVEAAEQLARSQLDAMDRAVSDIKQHGPYSFKMNLIRGGYGPRTAVQDIPMPVLGDALEESIRVILQMHLDSV